MAIIPNFWSADGISFLKKTEADFDTHYLSNGTYNLWLKFDANGVLNLKESAQYPLDKVFTPAEANVALKHFGAGSEALREVSGELILDVNGWIVYTS
jgi:hypothetical protein